MSTKTTFKRIALVAVAALGFGVLTSVAPASAANPAVSAVTALTAGPSRVGVATVQRFAITHAVDTGSDTLTVTATITSKPTLSSANIVDLNTGTVSSATLTRLGSTYGNATVSSGGSAAASVSTGTITFASTSVTTSYVDVVLTPDVAGSYTILLSTGNATYTAGDKNAVAVISTVGAPVTATLSAPVGTVIPKSGANGVPLKVVLKDANGNVTKPDAYESVGLAVTTGSASVAASLGSSDFAAGFAITNVTDTTASDTVVITLTGSGTLGSTSSLTTTIAMTSSAASNTVLDATSSPDVEWQQGTGVATTGFNLASQTSLVYPSTAASQSIGLKGLKANGAAADTSATTLYVTVVVTDTTGAITGKEGVVYDKVLSQAGYGATATSALSVSATLGTSHSYTVQLSTTAAAALTGETTLVVTGAAPAGTTTGSITPAIVNAALGSTNVFTAKVTDQFGVAFANASVTATVTAGRNAGKTAALASDAAGYVSYSLTDSGTTGTSDTVTFDGPGATNPTATINYGVATVKTATLTGGNTTAGVTATTPVVKDIAAGDGAEAGAQSFTVTVKDANGALLSGLPVVWTVSGTGAAITTTTATGYTSSVGTNSASVYAWIAGTYTVTATVGGVAATGTITFAQTGAGEERAISATADGQVVTAKVVDRFGNPVPGVTVYATKTGAGYFGAGVTKTSGTTATDGTVEFVVAGGSAEVTVSTLNWTAVAGTCPSGQTGALAGNLDCTALAADATAFTATTAGTALKDAAGVGASYAAAGVSKATVSAGSDASQAAADASAEATDAANAATDAANAAAEAADAATAAAQDAADAVAALSTQVSEMIDALKKQITALTNLVIKIQKKVKA